MHPPDPSPPGPPARGSGLHDRALVARATGVLMVTHGCTAEAALALLLASARTRRLSPAAVAAGVLAAVPREPA
ncbi:ANTAR domain-containing protein [Microlunatus capsulatus]|uniref:AmiR/NasT family two-component response regulator n=1 Tax=Microlunatus capsulatus TaxID=99117 RepID=A0ABS4Z399_9ACTN|nr:ANTAR domain-containing protein [Microlunatus capsulatus]MBP2415508.1 AmiR/NasT family two-component response regulator [Microlunatus capsulatus]